MYMNQLEWNQAYAHNTMFVSITSPHKQDTLLGTEIPHDHDSKIPILNTKVHYNLQEVEQVD